MKEVYSEVYVPTCEKHGLKCWRVDEIARPGSITKDIVEGILDADVIIADLTDRNANVFYELGIAHATGNKTIMTAQSEKDVPFDIASYRVIYYDHSLMGCKELSKKLGEAIKELLAALHRTNNPFQEVLSSRGGSLRVKEKTPFLKAINPMGLGPNLRAFLEMKNVRYLEDLRNISLDELVSDGGLGKKSVEHFCAVLLHFELYDDYARFHDFLIRNHLVPTDFRINHRHRDIIR